MYTCLLHTCRDVPFNMQLTIQVMLGMILTSGFKRERANVTLFEFEVRIIMGSIFGMLLNN